MTTITASQLARQKYTGMSRLRFERVHRGLTMREVTAALGLSSTSVLVYWETAIKRPSGQLALRFAAFYEVDVQELFPHVVSDEPTDERRARYAQYQRTHRARKRARQRTWTAAEWHAEGDVAA